MGPEGGELGTLLSHFLKCVCSLQGYCLFEMVGFWLFYLFILFLGYVVVVKTRVSLCSPV